MAGPIRKKGRLIIGNTKNKIFWYKLLEEKAMKGRKIVEMEKEELDLFLIISISLKIFSFLLHRRAEKRIRLAAVREADRLRLI